MSNQLLIAPKVCPKCGSDKTFTRDERTLCFMCQTPLVEHVPMKIDQESPSGVIGRVRSSVFSNERLTLIWQKLGRRKVVVGSGLFGILLLGSGLILGARNIPSSVAQGSTELVALGDTFVGYSTLRSPEFQDSLQSQGIDVKYADDFDQASRAQKLSTGEADLIVTTLDQVLRHRPEGKIVAMWDYTQGADAVVLNTKKFPLLKDMDALAEEVKLAAQSGQQYSIVYAADTPSEYLALLLANKFPSFRLEQFNLIPVADASEAYKLLQDPSQNIAIAVLWEPFVSQAEKSGHKVVLSSADVPEAIIDVLVASNYFIKRQPEALSQVLAAYYGRIDGSRLDATALKQQIAKEAKVSGPEALTLLNGIHFFNAREANDWLNGNQIVPKIRYTGSILKASGRLNQLPEQPERLYTGKFLDLAIANSTALDQQLSGIRPNPPQAPPSPPKAQPVTNIGKISEDIRFDLSSVLLDPEDKATLDTVMETAKGFGGNTAIQITGHTSATGSPERNEVLSKGRVESVAQYLKGKKFSGDLIVKRVGSSSPLPGVDPADARNQRVEVEVVRTGG
ncbi:hypothetical protein C1752_10574 [Acaryochloris thomasi RCC1774]|uniref:OmpA-like domain-containing protein n=1 Tax=Acaryochloris thomasi RCC1774 TaxID=1764569 RepID=A0A2W1JNT8_9CYAN|nr:OmpA family protein [Acaryochloris thomasi]PZD70567.1 hypothetical protein C1752_10574 [Acaryochloris thomasi RCC1774]